MRRNGDVHEAMPFPIAFIQVDGGSEFMADFERRREALRIPLEVLPPRRPQWNGCGLLTNRFLRERVPVTGAFQERRVGQRVQKGQQLRPFLRRHVEPLYELALVEVVAAVATLMPLHLKVLHDIFTPGRVRTAAPDLAAWGVDWTRSFEPAPGAVVFPETLDEVVALTRLGNAEGMALVPSGGRTGLSGGAVAANGEVVVSFDRMNRMLAFDPVDRLVGCQACVVTASLQDAARERGLFYPVDFASSGSSQIGGNVATNAGGHPGDSLRAHPRLG